MPWHNGRELSLNEWNLMFATNGATLRAACRGEGLPVSGTNAERGRRLAEAGLTYDQVQERYGWQARKRAHARRTTDAGRQTGPVPTAE